MRRRLSRRTWHFKLNVVEEDLDDNKFIECAVALKCTFVISGNKHLTEIRDYMEIEIVPPKEFLDSFPKIKSSSKD